RWRTVTRPRVSAPTPQPRYRQLAEALLSDIRSGRLKVGETLPGEIDLQEQFGVSRHTVREALRVLDDLGMIDRHQGVGTVVKSRQSTHSYVQAVRSPAELLQYPPESRLHVHAIGEVRATRKLARLLSCPTGTRWLHVGAARRLKDSRLAICWLDLYIVPEYAAVAESIGRKPQLVYEMIEQRFGEKVSSVHIDIRASALSRESAAHLEVEPGSPALTVIRRYVGNGKRVFQVSVSEHPADRYTYSLELRRGWQSGGDASWSAT
ncbi:MAG TPA: GntR family transcriptional regulator, partial [Steroidobacteraceae bacterium]|nr:GntR family transcriptional regulator [Steroidobacteraceae bacterium]